MKNLEQVKIYHIIHIDRLKSILKASELYCDSRMATNSSQCSGTNIGMNSIKIRRMTQNRLHTHPELYVGDCVPFYFCPRSIMLYVIHSNKDRDSELDYKGGQEDIIHLESSFLDSIAHANKTGKKWVFTDANAGSSYFQDSNDLDLIDEYLDFSAINSSSWQNCKEKKQAEFLIEGSFPFELVQKIGVKSERAKSDVDAILQRAGLSIRANVKCGWYY